ncbi:hypothetical protein [Fusibacter bizertensis]
MTYIICIDDTDTLDSKGTGEIAEDLSHRLQQLGMGRVSQVTRHQLFFHPDIPYTSHNSSMCFELFDAKDTITTLGRICGDYLEEQSAIGSDPGLCIYLHDQDSINKELVSFGDRAKKEILTKEEAYMTASKLGLHLSEHGGTGLGIIGALAGVALRLNGNDGRYKGKFFLGENCDNMIVRDILSHPFIDSIQDLHGSSLPEDEVIYVSEQIKTVRIDGKSVLLVSKQKIGDSWYWKCVGKDILKRF